MKRKEQKTKYHPEQTRQNLLEAAAEEIWKSGFRAASVPQILKQANVTKGALYHHFGSKKGLGLAVIDELIRESILNTWVRPLENSDKPLDVLLQLSERRVEQTVGDLLKYGCPLGNLAIEMSPVDEEFRERIEAIFQEWRDSLEQAFLRGQKANTVKKTMNPARTAKFIVSSMEGAICTAKSLQDRSIVEECLEEFGVYLNIYRVE